MAQDATGTPTSKGIPKYNTAVDAPSGKGFNAAMDALDTLLDGYVGKPSGIVSGEVPVWNGSAWVRSSVTKIGVGSLGTGSPSSSNFLRGDGTWASAGAPGYGTSLPGSPVDGEEYILVDSTTAPTYQWHFRYNSSHTDANKWEFLGGTPKTVTSSSITNNSTTFAVTNSPAAVTVPRAGNYLLEWHGIGSFGNNAAQTVNMFLGLNVNGAGAADATGLQASIWESDGASQIVLYGSQWREVRALAASDSLQLAYRTSTVTNFGGSWKSVFFSIMPTMVA